MVPSAHRHQERVSESVRPLSGSRHRASTRRRHTGRKQLHKQRSIPLSVGTTPTQTGGHSRHMTCGSLMQPQSEVPDSTLTSVDQYSTVGKWSGTVIASLIRLSSSMVSPIMRTSRSLKPVSVATMVVVRMDIIRVHCHLSTPLMRPIIQSASVISDGNQYRAFVSTLVPVNMLTSDDASMETSLGQWTALTNCAIVRDTAQHADGGTASMKMTSTASGDMTAICGLDFLNNPRVDVGTTVTVVALFRAAIVDTVMRSRHQIPGSRRRHCDIHQLRF